MMKKIFFTCLFSVLTVTVSVQSSVDYYAVICGISDYQGVINDLNYCDDDAYDVRDMLLSCENWDVSNITMLVDIAATTHSNLVGRKL